MRYYEEIDLTEGEINEALLEAKRKKYFRIKNEGYWQQQEDNARQAEEQAKALARQRRMKGRVSPALTSI